jgi:hypothetical protein
MIYFAQNTVTSLDLFVDGVHCLGYFVHRIYSFIGIANSALNTDAFEVEILAGSIRGFLRQDFCSCLSEA